MQVSASFLQRWATCPAQANFASVLELPEEYGAKQVFGTLIHMCLEEYNLNGDVEYAVAMWKKVWTDPGTYAHEIDFWHPNTSQRGYMSKGIDILVAYDKKQQWIKRKVLAVEHRFRVPFGKHYLKGFVDVLELRQVKGKWELFIVDHKTASRQPNPLALRQSIQMTTYYLATTKKGFWVGDPVEGYAGMEDGEHLWELCKDMPRHVIWNGLWMGKEFNAGPRNQNDFERLHHLIDQIEKSIEAQIFVPNISGDACGYCPFKEPCGLPVVEDSYDD